MFEQLPKTLLVTAWLFILIGCLALASTVFALMSGSGLYQLIDLRLLFVFIGFGLMGCKPFWRRLALVVAACAGGIALLFLILWSTGVVVPQMEDPTDRFLLGVYNVATLAVSIFSVWVLMRPSVSDLFSETGGL